MSKAKFRGGLSTAHIGPRASCYSGEGVVNVAIGAGVGALRFHHVPLPRIGGGRRGIVAGFSRGARLRMMRRVAAIKRSEVEQHGVWFLTLTYPDAWVQDWGVWKGHLKALRKRLERRFGPAGSVWRLEFQQRGAPHFHILWYRRLSPGETVLLRRWLSRAWYEVVGSGDLKHLRAGTNCTLVRNWNGVNGYVAKAMVMVRDVSKTEQDGSGDGVALPSGRVWGTWFYNLVGAVWMGQQLPRDAMMRLRRTMRRLSLRHVVQFRAGAGGVFDRVEHEHRNHGSELCTAWAFARWETWSRAINWALGRQGNRLIGDSV